MGFFYRAAGGGAGNDLTVPTGSITLDESQDTYNVTLTNTGTTPASVELSFQNSHMIGLDPDSGTGASPSYVVDPDAGSRVITIKRTGVSSSDQSERITFTSNQGALQFADFTLEPLQLHLAMRLIANQDPIYEWKFDGNFNDTGTRDTGTLSVFNSPTAVSNTTDLAKFVGYSDMVFDQYGELSGSQDINIKAGQQRSWLWIARLNTAPGTNNYVGHLLDPSGGSGTAGPFYLRYTAPNWVSQASYTYTYDSTESHTDGGSSVALSTTANVEIAILYVHDGSSTITVRWKTLNGNTERTGHSFVSKTQGGKSAINNPRIVGWSNKAVDWRQRHFSIYDTALTEADFIKITSQIGFGA